MRLFIKVEATKFTEVGYVGKATSKPSSATCRHGRQAGARTRCDESQQAQDAEERRSRSACRPNGCVPRLLPKTPTTTSRQMMRKRLARRRTDDKEIEIELAEPRPALRSPAWPRRAWRTWTQQLRACSPSMGGQKKTRKLKIAEAQAWWRRSRASWSTTRRSSAAVPGAEQNGIVFIDEIDKVASRARQSGPTSRRQGVARPAPGRGHDGQHQYGMVKTDHILFTPPAPST